MKNLRHLDIGRLLVNIQTRHEKFLYDTDGIFGQMYIYDPNSCSH